MSGQASIEPCNNASTSTDNTRASTSISLLPQQVVDQIAAGEVVQRPASVVKELLENSLDAGSTHIVVSVEKGGLAKLTISDNGCGIPKSDLVLAATRHATSKLRSVQDFHTLETYGFRGEALASISMVSNLTITSRTESSPVAYTQTYRNGVPTSTQPRPGARKPGTTLVVQDLFHNVPHRLRTYSKRESDEYAKILAVVQHYAIRYPHCGFCVERKHGQKGNLVDINTSQIPKVRALADKKQKDQIISKEERTVATKAVMAHVLEPNLEGHLIHLESASGGNNNEGFTYQAEIYGTLPNYSAKKSQFIVFLNSRLVDLPALKRSLEDVYSDFGKQNSKPLMVVAVTVPGSQVDVNVHPSKRQVALMYQEELCTALAAQLKTALHDAGQTFQSQSVAPKPGPTVTVVKNPYSKKRKEIETAVQEEKNYDEDGDDPDDEEEERKVEAHPTKRFPNKKPSPSQLIRTNKATPVGAIEPFLVSTHQTSTPSNSGASQAQFSTASQEITSFDAEDISSSRHKPDCPLSALDLTQPGAFAIQCLCKPSTLSSPITAVLVKRPVVRPKRVIPTKCSYSSVASLRRRVNKIVDPVLAKDLRDAYFVGVLSPFRSLVQCDERLMMIHHLELAKELFYQLALARFGGATIAQLGDGGADAVNIRTIIAQGIQLEDELILLSQETSLDEKRLNELESRQGLLETNETNQSLAQQATSCLVDHVDMLEEYFGVRIEKSPDDGQVLLTGLPVLLDGHVPEPHGLAVFLLRLATRVDWAEERTCFQGICRELGNYYALLPTDPEEMEVYVRHTLFPAISYLLLPPEHFQKDGSFTVMTKLSTLYKVFERC